MLNHNFILLRFAPRNQPFSFFCMANLPQLVTQKTGTVDSHWAMGDKIGWIEFQTRFNIKYTIQSEKVGMDGT